MSDVLALLDGAVARIGGTPREGQRQMAATVADALAHQSHALIQAGTGTGKSLAYLVPALSHAVEAGERIVVSTATVALQRQIVHKDLPAVIEAVAEKTGDTPRVALFKGRANYLCLNKMAGEFPEDEGMLDIGPTSDLGRDVARLNEWAEETDTGDRDDLVPGVSHRAWAQVSVTGRECLDTSCPLASRCFSQKAREEAANAHLVVTNHAMLGVQATSHEVLGEFDALVVDEAHELVQRVTSSDTHELAPARVDTAARRCRRAGVDASELERAARPLERAIEEIPPGRLDDGLPEKLAAAVDAVRTAAKGCVSGLNKAEKGAAHKLALAAAGEVADVADELLQDASRRVVWLAPPEGMADADVSGRLITAPLDVASLIGGGLVAERAAVFTSATLELGGDFRAASMLLGLDDPETFDAGSPFDYPKQGILYVARHLPRPMQGGMTPEAIDELVSLVEAAGGRTLGLFSSHRAAQQAVEAVRERLDVPVLYQGDDQLPTLVKRFREDDSACLFGSTSLWQGIDVAGTTSSLVVIDRIPFPRPDDPVMGARAKRVDERGGSGFMAVSATHAALLLAQGAGRLIRSSEDRGVVAVLDSRLATARYGEFLARSMPPLWRTVDREMVLGALRRLNEAAAMTD